MRGLRFSRNLFAAKKTRVHSVVSHRREAQITGIFLRKLVVCNLVALVGLGGQLVANLTPSINHVVKWEFQFDSITAWMCRKKMSTAQHRAAESPTIFMAFDSVVIKLFKNISKKVFLKATNETKKTHPKKTWVLP